jgi:hypothetical protein
MAIEDVTDTVIKAYAGHSRGIEEGVIVLSVGYRGGGTNRDFQL